jgi:hypothetical protein
MHCKLLVHEQNLRLSLAMFPEGCIISRALACPFRTLLGAMNGIVWLEHITMSAFANCMPSHACVFILHRGDEVNTNKRAHNKELEDCQSPTLRGSCVTSLRAWCWRRRYVSAALQPTTP